jgi:predicted esterase
MQHAALRVGARLCALALLAAAPIALARPWQPPPRSTQTVSNANIDDTSRTAASHRRLAVFLHGRCSDVEGGCQYFGRAFGDGYAMSCPRAPVACPGGGARWGDGAGTQRATVLESMLDSVESDRSIAASRPGVLVGFSEGAWVARSLLPTLHGRFDGVAFVGADMPLSAASLRAAGIRRVVLAAGRGDPSHDGMHATALRLEHEGIAVRWVDLGSVGHTLASAGSDAPWRDALAWLAASE